VGGSLFLDLSFDFLPRLGEGMAWGRAVTGEESADPASSSFFLSGVAVEGREKS
jgi:hypothetical protein